MHQDAPYTTKRSEPVETGRPTCEASPPGVAPRWPRAEIPSLPEWIARGPSCFESGHRHSRSVTDGHPRAITRDRTERLQEKGFLSFPCTLFIVQHLVRSSRQTHLQRKPRPKPPMLLRRCGSCWLCDRQESKRGQAHILVILGYLSRFYLHANPATARPADEMRQQHKFHGKPPKIPIYAPVPFFAFSLYRFISMQTISWLLRR